MTANTYPVLRIVQILITIAFIIGIFANLLALWILRRSSKTRNNKHVIMLRSLATNDLVAQFGMLLLMNLKEEIPLYWQCVLYVLFRGFGIGSGCIALAMAIERWLALTRPFIYQTFITNQTVKRCILIIWISAIILTYLPLLGFGIFYKDGKCKRYREATEVKDIIYAYTFFIFGCGIIFSIVYCNASIILELKRMGKSQKSFVRRCSRSTIQKYSTAEEISFTKFMTIVCVIFIICWMPQMISILLAQRYGNYTSYKIFGKIADILLCAYFLLNPYVCVLQRYAGKKGCKLSCKKNTDSSNHDSRSVSLNGTSGTPTAVIMVQV